MAMSTHRFVSGYVELLQPDDSAKHCLAGWLSGAVCIYLQGRLVGQGREIHARKLPATIIQPCVHSACNQRIVMQGLATTELCGAVVE
jgi:hypothetical protein